MDNTIIDKRTKGEWIESEFKPGLILSDNGEKELWQRNGIAQVFGSQNDPEARDNINLILSACNEYEKLKEQIEQLHKEIEWHKGIEEKLLNENGELLEALKELYNALYNDTTVDLSGQKKALKKAKEAIKKHSPIN